MDFFDTKNRQRIKQLEAENADLTNQYNKLAERYNDLMASYNAVTRSWNELVQDNLELQIARKPRLKLSALGDEFCCLVEDVVKVNMLQEFFSSQVVSDDIKRILKSAATEAREKYFTALSEHRNKTK